MYLCESKDLLTFVVNLSSGKKDTNAQFTPNVEVEGQTVPVLFQLDTSLAFAAVPVEAVERGGPSGAAAGRQRSEERTYLPTV